MAAVSPKPSNPRGPLGAQRSGSASCSLVDRRPVDRCCSAATRALISGPGSSLPPFPLSLGGLSLTRCSGDQRVHASA